MLLLPSLMMPSLWQQAANIPALVRLLQAYLERGGIPIHSPQTVQPLLGIFQKLVASKVHDHEGFRLLNSMVEYVPRTILEPYMRQILLLLLNRLQNSKTAKFLRGFIYFISLFIALADGGSGATTIITSLDAMQPRLFYLLLDSIYLAEVIKIVSALEKKACAVAMIKLLTACPTLLEDAYFSMWPKMLTTLIRLLEISGEEEAELAVATGLADDELLLDEGQSAGSLSLGETQGVDSLGGAGYHVMYAHLVYSSRRPHDPLKSIEDPKLFLAKSLHELSRAHPGRFPAIIGRLSEELLRFLNMYLERAGIHGLS
jgi:exportin-2 (importin alpha re-exporter)